MKDSNNPEAERLNPCLKEQELSYICLNKHDFDQDKCKIHFENYNTCKKFWGKVYSDRRAQGLYPYLPEVKDRAKIKEDYIKKMSQ